MPRRDRVCLAVTHPAAGNIGGGGFMLIRLPSGEVTSIDYREKAPLKATPGMYLDAAGKIDRSLTAAGYLAPGVPGTVRGLALAHQKLGRLSWKAVVMPAVRLAEEGFAMPGGLAGGLNAQLGVREDRSVETTKTGRRKMGRGRPARLRTWAVAAPLPKAP